MKITGRNEWKDLREATTYVYYRDPSLYDSHSYIGREIMFLISDMLYYGLHALIAAKDKRLIRVT